MAFFRAPIVDSVSLTADLVTMRILHLGGRPFVTLALAEAQRTFGHEVTMMAPDPFVGSRGEFCASTELYSAIVSGFDVVHLHRTPVLHLLGETPSQCMTLLHYLKEKGVIVFSSYDESSDPPNNFPFITKLTPLFDHIFRSWPKQPEWLPQGTEWSYLPLSMDHPSISPAPPHEDLLSPIRILYIHRPHAVNEARTVLKTLDRLRSEGFKFSTEIRSSEELRSQGALHALLKTADVLVDEIESSELSSIAYLALANGTIVLGGNDKEFHAIWPERAHLPVIHADPSTIHSRLEGIISEPRCLRDLRNRSRDYSESHFGALRVAKVLLDHYEKLQKRQTKA